MNNNTHIIHIYYFIMKKILFLAAMLLGVVSCQRDQEGFDVAVGGEQEAVITLSLPEVTRSMSNTGFDFGDFQNNTDYDLRFILEIHHGDKVVRDVQTSKNGTSATFSVRLVAGREYTFTAWADLVDEDTNTDLYYNTENGLANITLKEWTPMTEARDAYTCTVTEEFNPQTGVTMELKRPFAKVRVVSTDIQKVIDLGIEPTKAVVEYTSDLYTSYNAVLGAVAGTAAPKTHSFNYVDVDSYTDNTGEKTMFTDYILVPKGEGETVIFNIDIKDATGTIKKTEFNSAIPVEVNKLTTLRGAVLTEGGKVSITVDGELGEKETINVVGTASDLQQVINAIEDGEEGNIQLGGDINLSDLLNAGILSTRASANNLPIVIAENKIVTLDLNGFNITAPFVEGSTTNHFYAFDNKGTFIIKDSKGNGKIISRGNYNYGTMTLESGSIVACDGNGGYAVKQCAGEFVMNGGQIITNLEDDNQVDLGGYDATTLRVDNGAKATINGGTINNICDFTVAIDNNGELVINGGTITSIHTTIYSTASVIINNDAVVTCNGLAGVTTHTILTNNTGKVTINGGTFAHTAADQNASGASVINGNVEVNAGKFTGRIENYYGTPVLKGGNYSEKPADKYIDDDYTVVEAENGRWNVVRKADVAKIGEVGYTSLAKAVAAVNDGETITLVANEVFTKNNYYDNGGWKDGLGYAGDKSFTIDLGGNTISQDGYLNDYLLWFKNVGSKANTITIKNGTLDAGTTAYCALCTASSHENKLTVNIENINLVGNNTNGAVAKIRGGSELNVNAGTVITGKNNYVGIEAVGNNTVVNIYDNAEIYQNGTGSYVGAIVGASYNATMNIYGGYGKSAKCGIIVMSTGATINVSGGEWIANNDGTSANDNNAVLVSQNNRYETSWACKSILNVTGGTFKGGYNCYGMGPGVEPDDAQININGGNFNADPANYVTEGYGATEDNGTWSVTKAYEITEEGYTILTAPGMFWFANEVNSGANYFEGKTIKLGADIDLNNAEWTPIGSAYKDHGFMGNFDGNGYSIKNLKMTKIAADSDGYVYGGLFGVTEGVDKDNQNYIKNLTIENVNIDLDGHIVAAAIAYPYYTALENITVKGNVSIKGGDYTSGVLAYTRRCVDAKNISIEANAGSVIEGNITIGGVISDIQTNGGLKANYSNFKAENLTIKGTQSVGGISGIIGAQNLDGAIVKNVTIVSDDIRTGMISGSFDGHSVITNAVVENVTGADYYIGYLYSSTEGDRSSVTINGDKYTYNNGWIINGCKIIADGVILNETGEYIISNTAGMFWFANEVNVNKNAFNGKTVKLANDIDLQNAVWTPVGQTGATTFNGVFDGENYTIFNLNVNSEAQTGAHYSSGLFGWVESHTAGHGHLKNVKINGATINGHHNCGALVGYITQETALVENCHVTGATVTCTKANDDADGDKAGALIGNATVATPVKDCTATNSTVSAGRDAGQVIGAGKEANVTGCSATNVAVSANETSTGKNIRNEVIGRLL